MQVKPKYLWRYLSLAKYIDLISSQSLFCSSINNFLDNTEGEWLEHGLLISNEAMVSEFNENYESMKKINKYIFNKENPTIEDIKYAFNNLITEAEKINLDYSDDVTQVTDNTFFDSIDDYLDFLEYMEEKPREITEELKPDSINEIKKELISLKKRSYAVSWFGSKYQSMAMWNCYCQGEEGIAIKIKYETLEKIVETNNDLLEKLEAQVLIDNILYLDDENLDNFSIPERFRKNPNREFKDIFLKHIAYRYEQEVRLAILLKSENNKYSSGLKLKIDNVNDFVDEIYLNPLLDKNNWFYKVIKNINEKWDIDNNKIRYGAIKTAFTQ